MQKITSPSCAQRTLFKWKNMIASMFFLCSNECFAYNVNTYAGVPGQQGSVNGLAVCCGSTNINNLKTSTFSNPYSMVIDSQGNIFISETGSHIIRKITPSGIVDIFAGWPGSAGSSNGNRTAAKFSQPKGLAIDAADNIYVADFANNAIRKIDPQGNVTTLSLTPENANGRSLSGPMHISLGVLNRNNMFVTSDKSVIYLINLATNKSSIIAGNYGVAGAATNDTAFNVKFNAPRGIVVSSSGIIFVADFNNNSIRKLTYNSTSNTYDVRTLILDKPINQPNGLTIDAAGTLYVTSIGTNTVFTLTQTPTPDTYTVTELAGSNQSAGGYMDGLSNIARFNAPFDILRDQKNNITYIADTYSNIIRTIVP